MEVVSLSPRIVIFHDFISEHEVTTVKALARPKMHRAGVGIGEGAQVDRGVRDARHAWLDAELAPALGVVQRRTGDVTGFDMAASEPLQVGRYGVGGHFSPHYDHDTSGTDQDPRGGDISRIKTVIHLPQEIDSPHS
jgi:prolyl 4-hydroxylase